MGAVAQWQSTGKARQAVGSNPTCAHPSFPPPEPESATGTGLLRSLLPPLQDRADVADSVGVANLEKSGPASTGPESEGTS